MKVALVHDDFLQNGGAESLFATIASLWLDAPIYTSLVDWNKLPATISRNRVRPSFMQKIPFATKFYKLLLPLYPLAFESFSFDDFDIVISSTTRFANSIITKPKTTHICYLNSLPRFLWNPQAQKDYLHSKVAIITKPLFNWLKRWDKAASSRVDHYIANSQNIALKLKEFYKRESLVIYPFANLRFFKPAKIHNWELKSQNYFLIISRLVKWKKIDLAIRVALALNINLKIVGKGPDEVRLKKIVAGRRSPVVTNKIEFLGKVTKGQLRALYRNCQALIVTQEEDFGIALVEAQACGRPAIAYHHGGQQEIIKEGKTGLFFSSQTEEALEDAIRAFFRVKWKISAARNSALRFSRSAFVTRLTESVKNYAQNS